MFIHYLFSYVLYSNTNFPPMKAQHQPIPTVGSEERFWRQSCCAGEGSRTLARLHMTAVSVLLKYQHTCFLLPSKAKFQKNPQLFRLTEIFESFVVSWTMISSFCTCLFHQIKISIQIHIPKLFHKDFWVLLLDSYLKVCLLIYS